MTTDRSTEMRINPAARAKDLAELSVEKDHQRIVHLLAGYEFPWDLVRSLEIALLRSYASLSVSRLLDATGEFRECGQKRYDDTALLVYWGAGHTVRTETPKISAVSFAGSACSKTQRTICSRM